MRQPGKSSDAFERKSHWYFWKFTFDVGAPRTVKLPWPFFVKVGLRVTAVGTLPVVTGAFFAFREVDAFGATAAGGSAVPGSLGSRAVGILGNVPDWGRIQWRSNWNQFQRENLSIIMLWFHLLDSIHHHLHKLVKYVLV